MRALLACLATTALAALVAPPAAAQGEAQVRRLSGPDRFATAAAIAVDGWDSASDAVLARADDPADALAGAYVAGSHIGPVVLAERDRVPEPTIDALRSRRVHKVRVLGGPGALGPEVVAQLEVAGFETVRVAGHDRYATAAAVAADSGAANIGVRGDRGRTVLLASGTRPSDALSVGPLAYGEQWPVLLTRAEALPAPTRKALDDLVVRHVVVVGGTAAVSEKVVAELRRSGRTVERVAGGDREETATAVADLLVSLGRPLTTVAVAGSSAVADALALGPWAAPAAPLLLCRSPSDCGATTLSWISERAADVDVVVIAGGPAAVEVRAERQLQAAAAGGS